MNAGTCSRIIYASPYPTLRWCFSKRQAGPTVTLYESRQADRRGDEERSNTRAVHGEHSPLETLRRARPAAVAYQCPALRQALFQSRQVFRDEGG